MKLHRYFLPISLIVIASCDDSSPQFGTAPHLRLPRNAFAAAPHLIEAALAGARPRGPQDDMLKVEHALPGFGGFYIDSAGNVVVYMKADSNTPESVVRSAMTRFYETLPNPRERQIMSTAIRARILRGDYSLSELIAVENLISSRLLSTPGIVGVGTSLRLNRVKVGFRNAEGLEEGMASLIALGVSRAVLVPEVWGEPVLTSNFMNDPIRPAEGGIQISVGLRPNPFLPGYFQQGGGSLGFIVTSNGTKYFMTDSHVANDNWGQNGKIADSVWQWGPDPNRDNIIGRIAISHAWLEQNACPIDSASGAYPTYCTQSDIALGVFDGADGEKKVATSLYEGLNGAAGTNQINGFYSIGAVVSPEYAKDTTPGKGVHKSGAASGTTTGSIDLPLMSLTFSSYSFGNFPQSSPRNYVSMIFYNVGRVKGAGWTVGDSGGAVFAGNTSPYDALGLQIGGGPGVGTATHCTAGANCYIFFSRWDKIEADLGFSLNPITGQ